MFLFFSQERMMISDKLTPVEEDSSEEVRKVVKVKRRSRVKNSQSAESSPSISFEESKTSWLYSLKNSGNGYGIFNLQSESRLCSFNGVKAWKLLLDHRIFLTISRDHIFLGNQFFGNYVPFTDHLNMWKVWNFHRTGFQGTTSNFKTSAQELCPVKRSTLLYLLV